MEICSHTLEDVHCIPWNERYLRSPIIDQQCFEYIGRVLSSDSSEAQTSTVPEHMVEEINSSRLYKISIDFQKIAPLYKIGSDEKAGFIVTSKCKLLEAKRSIAEFEQMQRDIAVRARAHLNLVE